MFQTSICPETWVKVTWEEYLQATESPQYQRAKFYYHNGKIRIEMSPLGNDHASDHGLVNYAIYLYGTLQQIPLNGKDNCSYRKVGFQEAQPDLSYYVGETVEAVPYGTGVIDLDLYPAPNLVIEIAKTSFSDDQGAKRLLYEDLGVREYWIVDVENGRILAFAMANQGSYRIRRSQVLPNLPISLIEEALQRSRHSPQSVVGAWLLQQFQW